MTTTEPEAEPASDDPEFRRQVRRALRPITVGLAVLISLVGGGGVVIGAIGFHLISDIIHARSEGRAYTCAGDQYFEVHHDALAQTDQDVWRQLLSDAAKTKPADQQPAIALYAAGIVARYEATKVPVRGCSTAAIQAYIKWRTEHPDAVECKTDKRGYCTTPPTTTP